MAKSQSGSRSPAGAQRPDPTRIAGISGTLLFNGCAFLLLLIPMTQPALLSLPDRAPEFTWIDPKPVPPPLPPPLPAVVLPPTPAIPVPQAPVAPPAIVARDAMPAPSAQAPIVDSGEVPATWTDPGAGAPMAMPTAVAGVRLQYASAPPPTYPRQALLDGAEGTVVLEVLVGSDGRPREVRIHASSGDRRLDDAARRQVLRQWRFQPAMQDGRAVEARGLVPVDFNLGRG